MRQSASATLRIIEGLCTRSVICCTHLGDAANQSVGSSANRALIILRCFSYRPQPSLSGNEFNMRNRARAFLSGTGMVFGRSFFPLFAIAIIAGATLWGPWVSLGVTVVAIAAALRSL